MVRSPSGYPIQNPMLAIANKAQEQCLKILAEFGLTPSSRSRIRPDG
jgi:P27 family predicted phage terminase small subunit